MTKILNFGSLNYDYVYDVDHFVRAGETISSAARQTFCGGKGLNQSIALSRAGARVYHAGSVGRDGETLIKALADNHVDTSLIRITDVASGHAIIQRDAGGQNCIILFGGANRQVSDRHIEDALEGFSEGDYLVLQNEVNNLANMIKKAKDKGMYIALNPAPMDEGIHELPLELVDIFVLNEIEAEELCGSPDPEQAMEALRRRFPSAAVVLTLGKDGVVYQDQSLATPLRHGIYDVPVVDTTAAGDAFLGFFIASVSGGSPVPNALEIASIASSLTVSKEGASPSIPTISEVYTFKSAIR